MTLMPLKREIREVIVWRRACVCAQASNLNPAAILQTQGRLWTWAFLVCVFGVHSKKSHSLPSKIIFNMTGCFFHIQSCLYLAGLLSALSPPLTTSRSTSRWSWCFRTAARLGFKRRRAWWGIIKPLVTSQAGHAFFGGASFKEGHCSFCHVWGVIRQMAKDVCQKFLFALKSSNRK